MLFGGLAGAELGAGESWSTERVGDDTSVRAQPVLALDNSGKPHICYFADMDLKYARWTGAAWDIKDAGQMGMDLDMVLDSGGYPSVATALMTGSQPLTYLPLVTTLAASALFATIAIWTFERIEF